MIRILLLDCSVAFEERLKAQGFNVESGTVGVCTAKRRLPCQVYEKDIFVYNPTGPSATGISPGIIEDCTPQFSLEHLKARIDAGGTFIVFLNSFSGNLKVERLMYGWIPYIPPINFTHDHVIFANSFSRYPDDEWKMLAPMTIVDDVDLPVLHKLEPPNVETNRPPDVVWLFVNGNSDCLGVLIQRGRGRLIVLPTYKSNETVVETFLNHVVPKLYDATPRKGLVEEFNSPAERASRKALQELEALSLTIRDRQAAGRAELEGALRSKVNIITADTTAKQILIYYDQAKRQDEAALFYLYKIIESIENKYGGESAGIAALGVGTEWKAVKRLANESYRDARHAPRPTDVIKKWTKVEIDAGFENTEKVVRAYFETLFL